MPQGLANGDMDGKSLAVIGGNHLGIGLYGAPFPRPVWKPLFLVQIIVHASFGQRGHCPLPFCADRQAGFPVVGATLFLDDGRSRANAYSIFILSPCLEFACVSSNCAANDDTSYQLLGDRRGCSDRCVPQPVEGGVK